MTGKTPLAAKTLLLQWTNELFAHLGIGKVASRSDYKPI